MSDSVSPSSRRKFFAAYLARTISDVRAGLPLVLIKANTCHLLYPLVEGVDQALVDGLKAHDLSLRLILSQGRLHYLGMNTHQVGIHAGFFNVLPEDTFEDLNALAFAQQPPDISRLLQVADKAEDAFVDLLKRSGVIPSALSLVLDIHELEALQCQGLVPRLCQKIELNDLMAWLNTPPQMVALSCADVPLALGGKTHFVAFRDRTTTLDHVAVLVGERTSWPNPVPVRLHSQCLTGDIFASRRCDCGSQLHHALSNMEARGGGVLLYLAQEGRGIGIANKLRSYSMQDHGLDTLAANLALGFAEDERDFRIASLMLEQLDVTHIELLSNNPHKQEVLSANGIEVIKRTPLYGDVTQENRHYLMTKFEQGGHDLAGLWTLSK